MRTLGTNHSAAIARTITEPRYFLEIAFSTPLRLTTSTTQVWNSFTWIGAAFSIFGISWDGTISQRVSIGFSGGIVSSIKALALNEKLTNRDVKLWTFQGTDTSSGNVHQFPALKGINYNGSDFALQINAGIAPARVIPGRTYRTLVPDELFAEAPLEVPWGNNKIIINSREAL